MIPANIDNDGNVCNVIDTYITKLKKKMFV